MKLQPLSPMITGFSPSVQPVYGRPLFSSSHSHHHRQSVQSPNLLDYFPGLSGDGLGISWAHAVNSRNRLTSALHSEFVCLMNLLLLSSLLHQPGHLLVNLFISSLSNSLHLHLR